MQQPLTQHQEIYVRKQEQNNALKNLQLQKLITSDKRAKDEQLQINYNRERMQAAQTRQHELDMKLTTEVQKYKERMLRETREQEAFQL